MTTSLLSEELTSKAGLLELALLAEEGGEEEKQVLGDALMTTTWFDRRVPRLVWPYAANELVENKPAPDAIRFWAENPWRRAILAVLLFGDWSTQRWPVTSILRPPSAWPWKVEVGVAPKSDHT